MAARKSVLYLFDVDGTLTPARQRISQEFLTFLLGSVLPRVSIGLVSGSDYSKIVEQVGEQAAAQFDYVFPENGLAHYQHGHLKSQQSILQHLGEHKLQKVINYALGYLSKIELPAKRGTFIELRASILNISPVGRSCNQAEREQFSEYDAQHHVRKTFIDALNKEFAGSDLNFALGGQISIDVFPKGWDKTYCLNHVVDANFSEIHFFGDKTDPGGNDHEIYSDSRTIGHKVVSPEHTKQQLMQCLNLS